MYERLTSLIPALNSDSYGEWIIDRENDGTPEHSKQFPFVGYSTAVHCLEEEISRFVDEHKDFDLRGMEISLTNMESSGALNP